MVNVDNDVLCLKSSQKIKNGLYIGSPKLYRRLGMM